MSSLKIARRAVPLVITAILATSATAQNAPKGSCLVQGGQWCWPVVIVSPGQVCHCTLPKGPAQGVMQ